jgi:hypothetical protein
VSRRALVAGLLVAATASAAPLLPNGRTPVDVGASAQSAEDCAACHPAQTEAWRTSMHGRAWTDPTFRASFAEARMQPWCANCHIPLPEQQQAVREHAPSALLDEGITCVVCHVRDGLVLTATAPSPSGQDAHPMREEPALATPEFCAGCHQFANPVTDKLPVRYTHEPLQATYDEWRASGVTETCQGCHLQGHAFRGAHDQDLVRSALTVRVDGDVATITAGNVGHAIPTGDPFRRMLFRACADTTCDEPLQTWVFGRWFEPTARSWTTTRDTTLASGETRELPLPAGTNAWELEYRYAEPNIEDELPAELIGFIVTSGARPRGPSHPP